MIFKVRAQNEYEAKKRAVEKAEHWFQAATSCISAFVVEIEEISTEYLADNQIRPSLLEYIASVDAWVNHQWKSNGKVFVCKRCGVTTMKEERSGVQRPTSGQEGLW